jgi:hypothetical protein
MTWHYWSFVGITIPFWLGRQAKHLAFAPTRDLILMVCDSLRSFNSALFFMPVCVTPWGKEGSVSGLCTLHSAEEAVFVTTSLPALSADSIGEKNQSATHEHFLSGSNHPKPPPSILIICLFLSHEELVLRWWPPRASPSRLRLK